VERLPHRHLLVQNEQKQQQQQQQQQHSSAQVSVEHRCLYSEEFLLYFYRARSLRHPKANETAVVELG
jgi:hypothetical protein